MMEARQRTPLQAIQYNSSSSSSRIPFTDTDTDVKNLITILTYEIIGTGVAVQVLSSHTIRDLVDIVCQETCVGMNEQEWEHMWHVDSHQDGKRYESGDMRCLSIHRANETIIGGIRGGYMVGAKLILNYDYGSTSTIEMQLKSLEDVKEGEVVSSFPRRAPLPCQLMFVPHDPVSLRGDFAADMDRIYPNFSRFCFEHGHDPSLELFLFQPGRKKVQAFITKFYSGCKHMIHVPEKFPSLEEMFHAINLSCRLDSPNFDYNWFGVNLFPYDNQGTQRFMKYRDAATYGLDITVARDCSFVDRTRITNLLFPTFPKCTAAAGYNKKNKKSRAWERGWIVYRNGTLSVCRGSSKSISSKSPSPGVWDGNNKHEPVDDSAVVGKISIKLNSLQELFCAAESLWKM